MEFLTGFEGRFLISLVICVIAGFIIGVERESRKKSAGISTQCFIITGAMLFTLLSDIVSPAARTSIAAGIVSGVGFLGAGIILKSGGGKIKNLTTAASIWFSAAIGMTIGFGWYLIAVIAVIYSIIVPRIPHMHRSKKS